MDEYKRIFKSVRLRMAILKLLSFIPDAAMIKLQYRIKLKRKLNLRDPKRITEIIQWYKLYYRNPVMTKCVDKYDVREYIESKGLGRYLVPLYGVFDRVEDLDLANLPAKYIIKTTNGSGTNIIVNDSNPNVSEIKRKLNEFWKRPNITAGREWAYYGVKNRIIIEQLLEEKDNPFGGINDYKFICFKGVVACIVVDVSRFSDHKRNIYTTDWVKMDVVNDYENFELDLPAPKTLDEMLSVASELSKDFPFVRVDLYSVNDVVYFGELTFYPWSGYTQFIPDQFDFELGSYFNPNRE